MSEKGFIPIPNIIFDKYLQELKASEFLVLMSIIRKTWGWRKKEDRISVSQISTSTNLGKNTVIRSLKVLEEKGIISTTKKHNQTTKISLKLGIPKMGTPIPKMGTQLYPKVNTQQYNNNTIYEGENNVITGGIFRRPTTDY